MGVLKAKVAGSWQEIPQAPSPPPTNMYRVFATKAALDAPGAWYYPAEGAQAWTIAERMLWIYQSGAWISPAPRGYLAYAQVTAQFPSLHATTTLSDLTGVTVTVTLPASRRIRVRGAWPYSAQLQANLTEYCVIREGGTTLGTTAVIGLTGIPGPGCHAEAILTPTAGAHTYKLSCQSGNSSFTVSCDATSPTYIYAEDIGSAV